MPSRMRRPRERDLDLARQVRLGGGELEPPQAHRRDEEADRVDEDAPGRGERLGEEAADPGAGDLHGRLGAEQPRERRLLLLARGDLAHQRRVGGAEEDGAHAVAEGRDREVGEREDVEEPGDRHAGEGHRGDQVAHDHDAASGQLVHPGAGGQPDEQPRHPGGSRERPHPARPGVEADDGEEREQDRGGGVAEDADALAEPEQAEVPVAGQGEAGQPVWCGSSWLGREPSGEDEHRLALDAVVGHLALRPPHQHVDHLVGDGLELVRGDLASSSGWRRRRRPTRGRTRRWRSTRGCARTAAAGPAPRRRRRPSRRRCRRRSRRATSGCRGRPGATSVRDGPWRARAPPRPGRLRAAP